MQLEAESGRLASRAVSPFLEMGAYEALWLRSGTTFRSLAARFAARPGSLPSDFVPRSEAEASAAYVRERFAAAGVVEASGETSGTLIQARAALGQGRRLFVPGGCFRHGARAARLVEGEAVRVRTSLHRRPLSTVSEREPVTVSGCRDHDFYSGQLWDCGAGVSVAATRMNTSLALAPFHVVDAVMVPDVLPSPGVGLMIRRHGLADQDERHGNDECKRYALQHGQPPFICTRDGRSQP